MKTLVLTLSFLFALSSTMLAQEVVSTSGSMNDVYYSMSTGDVAATSNSNWDLAFEIKGFSGSVLLNAQKGNLVFSSPFKVSEWAAFDSTGYSSWLTSINSRESWSMGALSQNPSGDFDLGWGTYDVNTHAVTGDSIFMLALADGSFKKMYIKDLTTGVYTFVYSDIDGSNEQTKTISVGDYEDENFAYFSFESNAALSRDPKTATWDVLFTKYIEPINVGGGQIQNYGVSGVKINKGVEVAQRNGMIATSNDTMEDV
jgi:hypothetical protein